MAKSTAEEARTDRWIEVNDLVLTFVEALSALSVRCLSAARCTLVSRAIAVLSLTVQPGKRRKGIDDYRRLIGTRAQSMPEPTRYLQDLVAMHVDQSMLVHRLSAYPTWRPRIKVTNAECVEVLKGRTGVVLWALPFEFSILLLRLVAHDRGWPFHQLSHWAHGLSATRYGQVVFNRWVQKVENSYNPRILIGKGGARPALEQVGATLRGGGMVGFRGLGWARRPVEYPFLDGRIKIAMGAPISASRNSAALVLAIPRRHGPEEFEVEFQPLEIGANDRAEDLGRRFAAQIEAEVLRSPALWSVFRSQWQVPP